MVEEVVRTATGEPGFRHFGGEFDRFVAIREAFLMVAQQMVDTATGDIDFG